MQRIKVKDYRFLKSPIHGRVTHIQAGGSPFLPIAVIKETPKTLEVVTSQFTFILTLPKEEI